MATFKEASQVRTSLKMKLSNYSWYASSLVLSENGDCYVSINVKRLDDSVKKVIPKVLDGVSVKTELE